MFSSLFATKSIITMKLLIANRNKTSEDQYFCSECIFLANITDILSSNYLIRSNTTLKWSLDKVNWSLEDLEQPEDCWSSPCWRTSRPSCWSWSRGCWSCPAPPDHWPPAHPWGRCLPWVWYLQLAVWSNIFIKLTYVLILSSSRSGPGQEMEWHYN